MVEYIDDLEDYYLGLSVPRIREKRWTMEEVEKEIGLAD